MITAIRQLLFECREWLFAQPVVLSRAAQEDWATQPLPQTERAVRKEIRRLRLVKTPCDHLVLRLNTLEERQPYLRLLGQLPPMPARRRPASTAAADQFSVH